jgi:HlyD family secretion protein
MAKSKKRRKVLVFSIIVVVLLGLTALVFLKKRDIVLTIQTEKVARRSLTELVLANGRIQPVLQVKISAEVSGEIIALPVKEGEKVNKGDLLVKIKPDVYVAAVNQAKALYESALAGKAQAVASLEKAEADYIRNKDLFEHKLLSESEFIGFKASYVIAKAQLESSLHQVENAKAQVASAQDSLDKTVITSPMTATVSKLSLQLGERVAGNTMMAGTEIMTIADLNEMEARVDIGENDVVRIASGQKARLEVDAFKKVKFNGTVTEIANSSKDAGQASSGASQEATKFEVRIRIQEKEAFRPGMSVNAEIETCSRTNVLTVPFASVTTRPPKEKEKKAELKLASLADPPKTNSPKSRAKASPASTNTSPATTNTLATGTNTPSDSSQRSNSSDKKSKDAIKQIEVVFVLEGDHAKMVPVKIGISDDNYWEITDGLTEGQEVVSGGFKAITRELDDGKKIRKGPAAFDKGKMGEKKE